MNIILIRHGETEGNQLRILQGHSGIGLNLTGRNQAKLVAERLSSESVDIAFVSDLRRAKETADHILSFHKQAEVIFTPTLRERSFGVFEGQSWDSFENALLHSEHDFFSFRPPQGESLHDLSHRVTQFYMELCQEQPTQNILIVGHRDWLTMLYLHLRKIETNYENYIRHMPNNTAVSVVHMADSRVTYPSFNCTRHL